ncbi:MAG: CARDB domain-containing protein, partial [Synechococcaceae cyanobacterium]|nr:CARDB domain-containing protein [Synechococcaceae cyanobacterium]
PTRYAYPAKIICGRQDVPSDGRLVRGDYATTVNILNPSDRRARITKTLFLTFPPDAQRPGLTAPIATESLPAHSALKVDCADIASTVFGGTLPAPYVEGYVTVESATRLDVTGVYSSRDLAEAPPCDTGAGRCGRDSCKGPPCCGNSCKPAPSVSTTLDVVPGREILRPAPRRPALCPDLVVTDIGRPQVTCRSAQDSCVTRLDYTIGNIGTAASGAFQAQASADPDQGKTAVEQIESLLPGQDISISVLTTSGGNCFDPDCTLTVEADSKGKVKECREDNNSRTETTPG